MNSIRDIAKQAGVSVSTVSRVLNNSKPVSSELRETVMKVVEETGYTPNYFARSLVSQETKLIGIIIPRISNSFFAKLIEGIEEVALTYGYNILLSSSNNDLEKEIRYLNIFNERKLDGIIFSITEFTEDIKRFFEKKDIPTVFVGQSIEETPYPYVTIDNYRAGYESTKYLINQGHKKIGIIKGIETDIATGVERYHGYIDALKKSGIPFNDDWVASGYHTIDNGYHGAARIMTARDLPTAIFACSDLQALGAINYLQDRGFQVPEDLSVVGFDDSELASLIKPRLTTIHQNPFDIGATAMRLLVEQFNATEINKKEVLIPHRLIVRESVKKLVNAR